MPIRSLTKERVRKTLDACERNKIKLQAATQISPQAMWLHDLGKLRKFVALPAAFDSMMARSQAVVDAFFS
jgi:hypothetical protein